MKISTQKTEVFVSSETKEVYAASERHCTAAGGEVQVPWGGIHEWGKAEQGDCYTDW